MRASASKTPAARSVSEAMNKMSARRTRRIVPRSSTAPLTEGPTDADHKVGRRGQVRFVRQTDQGVRAPALIAPLTEGPTDADRKVGRRGHSERVRQTDQYRTAPALLAPPTAGRTDPDRKVGRRGQSRHVRQTDHGRVAPALIAPPTEGPTDADRKVGRRGQRYHVRQTDQRNCAPALPSISAADLAELINELRDGWREHIGLERAVIGIKQRIGADARAIAYARAKADGTLPPRGFPKVLPEDEASARQKRARLCGVLEALEKLDKEVDKGLRKLAARLPVASFCDRVPGFAIGSLAGIIGHAGNLGAYHSEAALWKRLGVGIVDGKIQKRPPKGCTWEDAMRIGYSTERRAFVHTLGENLVRAASPEWKGAYDARKAYEIARFEAAGKKVIPAARMPTTAAKREGYVSAGHVHKRALRYIEKKMIRKLYRAWCATTGNLSHQRGGEK